MADRIYKVNVKRSTTAQIAFRTALLFVILILAIGTSRTWFGGSWLIDLFALVVAFCIFAALLPRLGESVNMTPAQLRAWLDAGCPDDWKGE